MQCPSFERRQTSFNSGLDVGLAQKWLNRTRNTLFFLVKQRPIINRLVIFQLLSSDSAFQYMRLWLYNFLIIPVFCLIKKAKYILDMFHLTFEWNSTTAVFNSSWRKIWIHVRFEVWISLELKPESLSRHFLYSKSFISFCCSQQYSIIEECSPLIDVINRLLMSIRFYWLSFDTRAPTTNPKSYQINTFYTASS